MIKKISFKPFVFILFIVCLCIPAPAAFITFHGQTALDTGTGLGNVLTTLVVQKTPSEWGSVSWNGSSDVRAGDASPTSKTQTVTDILAEGINAGNLSVIFNLNQTGGDNALALHEFTVTFYDTDATVMFSADYDATDLGNADSSALTPDGQGIGSAGYVFPITFAGSQGSDFFTVGSRRIGVSVPQLNPINNTSNDGAETFYVGMPEPTTLLVIATVGLPVLLRRRPKS